MYIYVCVFVVPKQLYKIGLTFVALCLHSTTWAQSFLIQVIVQSSLSYAFVIHSSSFFAQTYQLLYKL